MDNSTPNMSEQLVLHLDGELADAEKKAIELLLVTDTALQTEFENLLQAREAVRYFGLRQQVASVHNKMMQEMQQPVRKITPVKKMLRYSLAAAASLVLLIGGYMAYNFFTLSSGKVFSANYNTYELSNVRDGGSPESTPAEKAFAEKNFTEVLKIYNAGNGHTAKEEFLCGIAAIELKNDSKAIQCFNKVIEKNKQAGETVLNDEAEYYLALTYIRNKDYDFALPLLSKIKNDTEHKYHNKISSRLIRKVKMLKWR